MFSLEAMCFILLYLKKFKQQICAKVLKVKYHHWNTKSFIHWKHWKRKKIRVRGSNKTIIEAHPEPVLSIFGKQSKLSLLIWSF